jgi:hypothetical protein
LNDATGIYTLWEADDTTVLKTANAWEDEAMTIPYRGRGLAVLERMQ